MAVALIFSANFRLWRPEKLEIHKVKFNKTFHTKNDISCFVYKNDINCFVYKKSFCFRHINNYDIPNIFIGYYTNVIKRKPRPKLWN